jgi:hypothetical protein
MGSGFVIAGAFSAGLAGSGLATVAFTTGLTGSAFFSAGLGALIAGFTSTLAGTEGSGFGCPKGHQDGR